MTVDEIKATYSMRDIVERYGFKPNRAGFIHCPFHSGDRDASLKVYAKDFHCHACSANGDIFTFVQMMEEVPFKEAFLSLGGTYEKPTFQSRLAIYKSEQRKKQLQKERERQEDARHLNNLLIDVFRSAVQRSEPLSDCWCSSYNELQKQLYIHGELNSMPY